MRIKPDIYRPTQENEFENRTYDREYFERDELNKNTVRKRDVTLIVYILKKVAEFYQTGIKKISISGTVSFPDMNNSANIMIDLDLNDANNARLILKLNQIYLAKSEDAYYFPTGKPKEIFGYEDIEYIKSAAYKSRNGDLATTR